jgi:hypothetical protein
MLSTVEKPEAHDHSTDWLAGVAEDAAFIVMLFSFIVAIAAIIALEIAS